MIGMRIFEHEIIMYSRFALLYVFTLHKFNHDADVNDMKHKAYNKSKKKRDMWINKSIKNQLRK